MKSNKTLEEAIAFFESDVKSDEVPIVTKRRGGRRKKNHIKVVEERDLVELFQEVNVQCSKYAACEHQCEIM